jgi:hypothetical protein
MDNIGIVMRILMIVDSTTVLQNIPVFPPHWATHVTRKTDAWTFQLIDSCHLQTSVTNPRTWQHQHQDSDRN